MTRTNVRFSSAILTVATADGARLNVIVKGHNSRALEILKRAGRAGWTPIDRFRQSLLTCIHQLRCLVVDIENIRERNDGSFSGTHVRYVLRSLVTLLKAKEERA
ncbi:hypothetical protein LAV78_12460 [Brucella intermedia]|uniref:winged helix domain-containing protein n=1 Tax=Brucella intermedia TaxID=94625 RepID=UPI001E49612E|nr:hypothetical protein [Brucella intermedia]MCB4919342.1 hypothetical protein [Brucella intermedia]